MVLGLALGAAFAQNAFTAAAAGQGSEAPPSAQTDGASGGPGGHGGWRGEGSLAGRGLIGSVTATAAGSYIVQNDAGQAYTVQISSNTRILKQMIQRSGPGESREGSASRDGGEGGEGGHRQRTAPQTLKPTDIKVGDAVAVLGDVDEYAKSVTATLVLQLDPERVQQMREMQASFGKTWLMGQVTAINETTVTLLGTEDHAAHAFVADENTTFRKRRQPITLTDIQVGDTVRAKGYVKDGAFLATSVDVLSMPPGGRPPTLPRYALPTPAPEPQ
jgi:hypothetical protein